MPAYVLKLHHKLVNWFLHCTGQEPLVGELSSPQHGFKPTYFGSGVPSVHGQHEQNGTDTFFSSHIRRRFGDISNAPSANFM
jgi:hypothetical protein